MKADVLLIHPPVNFHLARRPIQFSQMVGYGLLHIAACLVQMGYRVTVWNLENSLRMGISPQSIQRSFKACDPAVVGIELNWVSFSRGAIQTAELLKAVHPDVPVILGGTHATIFSDEIIQKHHSSVDAVLTGEAEKTFPTIVKNLEEKGRIGEVGGLVTFDGRCVRKVPRRESDVYANIDDIPPYSIKVVRYVKTDGPSPIPLLGAINTCRGPCKFNCVYCIGRNIAPISGRTKFSVHSEDWVVDQINQLIDEGSKWLTFQDYLFLIGKKRLVSLARAIRREKINEKIMGINMTAIPGILDRETLNELSKAGIYNIDYGAESGSNRILRIINRPTSRDIILDAVKATISEGIMPVTWWMTGLPKERPEDIKETLDLINGTIELGSIPGWVTPLVVMPGTELFEKAQDYGIRLRLKTFEDFAVHSELEMRAVSWYPEVISHETEYLSRYDILRAAIKLKLEIFRRREEIAKNFVEKYADNVTSLHPQLTNKMLESQIHASLGSLLINHW